MFSKLFSSLDHFCQFLDKWVVRNEAIDLVNSVLEESVSYLRSRLESRGSDESSCVAQQSLGTTQDSHHPAEGMAVQFTDQFLHSDSENIAMTSDLSNGAELLKSPTIESISGRSFNDDFSPHEDNEILGYDSHHANRDSQDIIPATLGEKIGTQFTATASTSQMTSTVISIGTADYSLQQGDLFSQGDCRVSMWILYLCILHLPQNA